MALLTKRTEDILKIAFASKLVSDEITSLVESAGVAASFDGLVVVDGGTGTLTVSADVPGVAGNKTITGDGTSSCSVLIGAGYTIAAGGAFILESGSSVNIAGGADAIPAVAAQFSGQVAGMTTDVVIDADVAGVAGNVTLTADGIKDIATLISDHNAAFPANTLTLSSGDDSQIPTANIVLSGGANLIPAVAASYNGLINKQDTSSTLTVVADAVGVAYDKLITGDGVSDCSTLIGAGYTISAGGAVVMKLNATANITGGDDPMGGSFSATAKKLIKWGFCDSTSSSEFISLLEAGSGSMSSRTKKILSWVLCDNAAYREIIALFP